MEPGAIRHLDLVFLELSMRGIEWGSGRSTTWFAQRVTHLTSVEHDEAWAAKVRADLARDSLTNVDLRVVALEHDPRGPAPEALDHVPAYVAVADAFADGALDLAIVDGHYRPLCVLMAIRKLRSGGILVIDDIAWLPGVEAELLPDWAVVYRPARKAVGTTMIFRKP